MIYYSTHAPQNEIYLLNTFKNCGNNEQVILLITIYIKSALKIYVLLLYDVIRDQYSNGARTRTNEIASFILIILIREYYLLFRHDDNFDVLHVRKIQLLG